MVDNLGKIEKLGSGRQTTDDGRRRTEDGGQKTEGGGRRTEDRRRILDGSGYLILITSSRWVGIPPWRIYDFDILFDVHCTSQRVVCQVNYYRVKGHHQVSRAPPRGQGAWRRNRKIAEIAEGARGIEIPGY